mgnify:CR=1 FL=1
MVPKSVSSLNRIEPAADAEPVRTGAVRLLFVRVWLPVSVATVESIANVTVVVAADVPIPVPPVSVTTVVILKKGPGSMTALPEDPVILSRPTEIP